MPGPAGHEDGAAGQCAVSAARYARWAAASADAGRE
ncbi:hypothetical protein J2S43_002333 [Catenuloplanes nepalensis]|uniref:Uncharacterized protein n=1 Tax=Catenuloplanes nepalensis TaxID=587533 RepID=A0ABT9MS16_9ACTN|nr:hypothetical protein [Catenuloplanes nepalensis]